MDNPQTTANCGAKCFSAPGAEPFTFADVEGWRVRADGSRFWALAVMNAVRALHGELIGFAKVTRDITERRWEQSRLLESERQFHHLVSQWCTMRSSCWLVSPPGARTHRAILTRDIAARQRFQYGWGAVRRGACVGAVGAGQVVQATSLTALY